MRQPLALITLSLLLLTSCDAIKNKAMEGLSAIHGPLMEQIAETEQEANEFKSNFDRLPANTPVAKELALKAKTIESIALELKTLNRGFMEEAIERSGGYKEDGTLVNPFDMTTAKEFMTENNRLNELFEKTTASGEAIRELVRPYVEQDSVLLALVPISMDIGGALGNKEDDPKKYYSDHPMVTWILMMDLHYSQIVLTERNCYELLSAHLNEENELQ